MINEAPFEPGAQLGAPAPVSGSSWVVMKFGGSSISTADNWQTIAGLLRRRLEAGLNVLVVHSALQGVSDALQAIMHGAVDGADAHGLAAIRAQHLELAAALGLDGPALLEPRLAELEQLIAGIRLVREVSIRVEVRIMALGELMAA